MSKGNTFETDWLNLILLGTAITGLAQNHSSPLTNLYLALHTADPGEGGSQSTNEVTYGSYTRIAVGRTGSWWSVSAGVGTLLQDAEFPLGTSGSGTATHVSLGTDSSGAGKILYSAALPVSIPIGTGYRPRLKAGTTISED